MTLAEMRTLTGLSGAASDAAVVAAYAQLVDDGLPASITLVEPVTVEMARMQCGIEDEISDDFISQKIRSAREIVESPTMSGRIVAQQTLVAHFRSWGQFLEIPKRPIISIDAIAFNGVDGDAIYADGAFSLGTTPMRIVPSIGSFPALRAGGGVTVAYTAGYDPDEVPYAIIEAILVLVGGMIDQREGGYAVSMASAKSLTSHLRRRTA